jgi:RNA polymerase sigma-70 factor (TIGR02943 family)
MDASKTSETTNPNAWLDRHGDYLFRFAVARVRRSDLAEDLVQETLLAAWKARATFAGDSSERTWLTAILKRKVIDWLRGRIRDHLEGAISTKDAFADELFTRRGKWKTWPGPWNWSNPSHSLDRAEFWDTLHDCMDKLPPRLHDAFVLRYLDEAACDDVCRELALSSANLWVMLHRARLRMWSCLEVNWFGDETKRPEKKR